MRRRGRLGCGAVALVALGQAPAHGQTPLLAAAPPAATAAAPAPADASVDAVLAALRDEIARAKDLRLPDTPPPYFVAATLSDADTLELEANLGALVVDERSRSRQLKVEARVGDAALDGSNFVGDGTEPVTTADVPFENDYLALRRELWLALDTAYKGAARAFEAKRADRESKSAPPSPVPSLAPGKVEKARDERVLSQPDRAAWAALLREASTVLGAAPFVSEAKATLSARVGRRWYASAEGAEIVEPVSLLRLTLVARTQAEDGMRLVSYAAFVVKDAALLPAREALLAEARRVADELAGLRKAPVVDDYTGPVLFEGLAAPQLLRVLFADELSGTPPPDIAGASAPPAAAFAERVGWRVLPRGFQADDDPGRVERASEPWIGGYRFDDEGVAAEPVTLVDDGVLRALTSSRTPSAAAPRSNGHGRGGISDPSRGAIANLLVRSAHGVPRAALHARLLREARGEGLDRALIVRTLDEPLVSGSQSTSATLPAPIVLVEVGADGRERLLRGAELQSLGPRDLRHVLAAGNRPTVYGYLGSSAAVRSVYGGDLPTSLGAPDLLLSDADVRRSRQPLPKPPVLAPPPSRAAAK